MAKCDLTIALDEPDRVYAAGETVGGVVRVQVDADVACDALEVAAVWRTHGKGNVAEGESARITLYHGPWMAGERHQYRFELPVPAWPPTYHGHYLNVDHYIDARAKIPWAFDPKASEIFMLRPAAGPEPPGRDRPAIRVPPLVGCLIGLVIPGIALPIFLVLHRVFGFLVWLFAAVPLGVALVWLVRWGLPRWLLGNVEFQLTAEQATPGQTVAGELILHPRRNVSINGIELALQAHEVCVSGSGSNRTTHRHSVFVQSQRLSDAVQLTAGSEQHLPFTLRLPDDAPFSIDLRDNDLIWNAALRIDLPRWPDWRQERRLLVVPVDGTSPSPTLEPTVTPPAEGAEPLATEVTFDETARYLWTLRDDRQGRERLLEAVTGLTFDIAASIERRLLYSGAEDPQVYRDGHAVWAHYPDPPVPLVLYAPRELADEFEQHERGPWQGRGTIVGWDSVHERLQIKVEPRN